jgi:hypothetical protein
VFTIASLKNQEGEEINDRRGLQELCHDFYANLYAILPVGADDHIGNHSILQHVPKSFIPEMGL